MDGSQAPRRDRRENPPFPFFGHRTLADVDDTARLRRREPLAECDRIRLSMLLWKAERHNPPPAPSEPGAAA